MFWSIKKAGLVLLLATIFVVPELLVWVRVDGFKEPLRYYDGDAGNYISVLNGALRHEGAGGNAYFFEDQATPGFQILFQKSARLFSSFRDIPLPIIVFILRLYVVFGVFAGLVLLLRLFEVPGPPAWGLAFAFVALYGVPGFQGYALGNWFLPGLLFALYCTFKALSHTQTAEKKFLYLFGAIVLFSFHAAYFALGSLFVGIAWLIILFHNRTDTKHRALCALWVLGVFTLFAFLFYPALIPSEASADLLERMALVKTYFPVHPLIALRLLFFVGASYLLFRSFVHQEAKNRTLALAALGCIMFLLLNVPIITGRYLVNDHYTIAEDFVTLVLFSVLVFGKYESSRWTRGLGFLGMLVGTLSALVTLAYLKFKLGYYGRWAPMHGAYFWSGTLLLFPDIRSSFQKLLTNTKVLSAIVLISFSYGLTLSYKDTMNGHVPGDSKVQEYRELISVLKEKAPGVVLANTFISNLSSLYTHHWVYWSPFSGTQPATNEVLQERWMNTRLFFSEDPQLGGAHAAADLVGAIDQCRTSGRRHYLEWLKEWGFEAPYNDICGPLDIRLTLYAPLEKESDQYSAAVVKTGVWDPFYRIDYLVFDTEEDTPPAGLLKNYFVKEGETMDARFVLYRRK